jgi:hypothetical protein
VGKVAANPAPETTLRSRPLLTTPSTPPSTIALFAAIGIGLAVAFWIFLASYGGIQGMLSLAERFLTGSQLTSSPARRPIPKYRRAHNDHLVTDFLRMLSRARRSSSRPPPMSSPADFPLAADRGGASLAGDRGGAPFAGDRSERKEQLAADFLRLRTLTSDNSIKTLELTNDQQLQINSILKTATGDLSLVYAARDTSAPDAWADSALELVRRARSQLEGVLTEEQKQRWHSLLEETRKGA